MKVVLATAATALLMASPAMAYHSGGVADCEGCHTMHNSLGGTTERSFLATGAPGAYLLQGTTQSEVCLNCHDSGGAGGYHISTASTVTGNAGSANGKIIQFTPGGDFRWLTVGLAGASSGHSINAPNYGYLTSAETKTTAPGGTYLTANLNCSSCHDPHGKYRRTDDSNTPTFVTSGAATQGSGSYGTSGAATAGAAVGSYRLLAGNGYSPDSLGGSYTFTNNPPIAFAPATYNVSETTLGGTRVAYGWGMSEWCQNCHPAMHNSNYTTGAGSVHPAGNTLGTTFSGNYNGYVNTGNNTGGSSASAWNALVPFEVGQSTAGVTIASLKTIAKTNDQSGPTATGVVMCLSCHRAHASGFSSMLRFNVNAEFITDGSGNYLLNNYSADSSHSSVADFQTALYNRPSTVFGNYQRDLCNKCHVKD